jgi:hypothetical protein
MSSMSRQRMSSKRTSRSRKISSAFSTVCLLAVLGVTAGASEAAAASASKSKNAVFAMRHVPYARGAGYGRNAYYNYAGAVRDRAYAPRFAQPATLPYAPEYGFLRHVPPNAVTGPGYVFVPGKGILGESCDLPTSACSNEYRDIQ